MKVIVLEPGMKPEVKNITGDYDSVVEIIGGYLEVVSFMSGASAIVDEEAKVNGKPFTPNFFATILWQRALSTIQRTTIPGDGVVNTMVIVGSPDDEGNWQDVPQAVIDFTESLWDDLLNHRV